MILFSKSRRPGATAGGIFGLAFISVLLLCGAGSVPVQNFLPQGTMQGDLNAGSHNITNAATVSAVNVVVSGGLTAPSSFTLPFSKITSTPTTLSGYGITDPIALTSGSYADPSWITSLSATKLTGTINAARLPNPTASTLGGVQAAAAVSHQWINSISTSGVPAFSQPAFGDVSGSVAAGQMPALTGDVTTSAGAVATSIAANAVTNAKLAAMAANTMKANATGSSATPTDVSVNSSLWTPLGTGANVSNGFAVLNSNNALTINSNGASYQDNTLFIGNRTTNGTIGNNGFAAISFLDPYSQADGFLAFGVPGNSTLKNGVYDGVGYWASASPIFASSGYAYNDNEYDLAWGDDVGGGTFHRQIELVYQDPAAVRTTATTTNGSATMTITGSTSGLSAISGGRVYGPGVAIGTTWTISGSTVTLSANATQTTTSNHGGTGEYYYFCGSAYTAPRKGYLRGWASGQNKGPVALYWEPVNGQVAIGGTGSSSTPTITGTASLSTPSLAINGSLISLAGNFTTSGAFASTFTMTGATTVTFPTSGTLISSANLGTNVLTALGNATNSANGLVQLDGNALLPLFVSPTATAGSGTIAISGTTVTGTGSSFATQCPVGTTILIGGNSYSVVSVASNTSMTIDTNTSFSAGTSYNVAPRLFGVELFNSPLRQTTISGFGYPITTGQSADYSYIFSKNGNSWGIFIDNSTGLFSIRPSSGSGQPRPLEIDVNAPDAAINISSTGVSTKGVLKQTSVTSAMLKADGSGNLVGATGGTDYMAAFVSAPSTSSSSGTAGQIAYDSSYFYVCTGTNTWKRTALSTW